jgi:hypothetical protein
MTSGEPPDPPDGEEEPGTDLGRISGSEVPTELDQVMGDEDAVLFIPDGLDPSQELNVKVVGVNPTTMGLIIARRC